ncbi:MAG: FMN-binding protein [Lentisphaeria bacterium]|nr:FMN-binding protein [Lentisphaeria bacterium]
MVGQTDARKRIPAFLAAFVLVLPLWYPTTGARAQAAPDLERELAALRVPPPWLESITPRYDLGKPWKEARLHVRKLLDQRQNREAIAITYDYIVRRGAAPDEHEYPLYLYLGCEYAWALSVYRKTLDADPQRETIAYTNLASLYLHYGLHQQARETLLQGLEHLPKPPWDVPNQAKLQERLGDTSAVMNDAGNALLHYARAIELHPASKQPWGRQNLPKHVLRLQGKCDLLERGHRRLEGLRDGTYRGTAIGYAGDIVLDLQVRGGRVAAADLTHKEHIEQGTTVSVPAAIVASQSLAVDAVTAATITTEAILEAGYRAARKAGLR